MNMTRKPVPQLLTAALLANKGMLSDANLAYSDLLPVGADSWLSDMSRELFSASVYYRGQEWFFFGYLDASSESDDYYGWASITHDGLRVLSQAEMQERLS